MHPIDPECWIYTNSGEIAYAPTREEALEHFRKQYRGTTIGIDEVLSEEEDRASRAAEIIR